MDARISGLLEYSPDAILLIDESGRILRANAAAAALTGYTVAELEDGAMASLIPERLRGRHAEHVRGFHQQPVTRPMAAAPMAAAAMDFPLRRADGTELAVEISLRPIRSPGGLLIAVAVRDVSRAKQVEAELAAAERLASLGMLAAGVAHEINNPLVAVLCGLELLRDDVGRHPELAACASAITDAHDAGLRIRAIVRDLLAFARDEPEDCPPVDVVAVIESTLRLAANAVHGRVRVEQALQPVPLVQGCSGRLGQVVLNLIVNAAHAIPEPRSDGVIRVASELEPGGWVAVEVTDNGIGMSPSTLATLFVPFGTSKPAGAGTGLGLAICQRIVTAIGGQIVVTSELGTGSTFRIRLPPALAAPAAGDGPADAAPAGRRGRVLVVDDDPAVLRLLCTALRDHEVVPVVSGAEALDLLAGDRAFDLVLCDLMTPALDGMQLHARACALSPALADRFVFMSGGGLTTRTRDFLRDTGAVHLEKPFDLSRLRELIAARLG